MPEGAVVLPVEIGFTLVTVPHPLHRQPVRHVRVVGEQRDDAGVVLVEK